MGCTSSTSAVQHDEIVCTGQMHQEEITVFCRKSKETEVMKAKKSVTFQEAQTFEFEIFPMESSMRSIRSLAQDLSDEGLHLKVFLQALQHAPHVLEKQVASKRRRDFGSA